MTEDERAETTWRKYGRRAAKLVAWFFTVGLAFAAVLLPVNLFNVGQEQAQPHVTAIASFGAGAVYPQYAIAVTNTGGRAFTIATAEVIRLDYPVVGTTAAGFKFAIFNYVPLLPKTASRAMIQNSGCLPAPVTVQPEGAPAVFTTFAGPVVPTSGWSGVPVTKPFVGPPVSDLRITVRITQFDAPSRSYTLTPEDATVAPSSSLASQISFLTEKCAGKNRYPTVSIPAGTHYVAYGSNGKRLSKPGILKF